MNDDLRRETLLRHWGNVQRNASHLCDEDREILLAAVQTMASAFADVAYHEIPHFPTRHAKPELLAFFMSGVRWHWAMCRRAGDYRPPAEAWTVMHEALSCPFTDLQIDQLIRRYESLHGPIWMPDESCRTAEHDRYKREGSAA